MPVYAIEAESNISYDEAAYFSRDTVPFKWIKKLGFTKNLVGGGMNQKTISATPGRGKFFYGITLDARTTVWNSWGNKPSRFANQEEPSNLGTYVRTQRNFCG